VLGYDEFARVLLSHGVAESAIRDGLSLYRRGRYRVARLFYDGRTGKPVGALLFVGSRSREGVEHVVTVGEGTAKCTCEDSVYNGNVCAHMVAGLRLMWDAYRARGEEFPLDEVVRRYLARHGRGAEAKARAGV